MRVYFALGQFARFRRWVGGNWQFWYIEKLKHPLWIKSEIKYPDRLKMLGALKSPFGPGSRLIAYEFNG
ncbi:hypothetical protein [Methylocaldum szegediense]|uniref:hypothetical protein n=1 Tax=Methylocaldum szegediense TaxID=73780 RepID=UPI0003FB8442|nr:hypothetical protein [Methylocaldum szegediense]